MALELGTAYVVVVTAEGIGEDVESELQLLREELQRTPAGNALASPISAVAGWQRIIGATPADALLVRVGLPTQALEEYLQQIDAQLAMANGLLVDLLHGLIYLAYRPTAVDDGQRWLAGLRQAAESHNGYAAVMATPPPLQGAIDRWHLRPAVQARMAQLRQRWDPQGIFANLDRRP
ncbi:MAG: hypothetical protein R2867_43565 [Caldilineaceae bacterium]